MKNVFAVIAAGLLIVSCSSKPPKTTAQKGHQTVSIEGQQLASEEESNYVSELTFSKGRTGLTKLAKADLKKMFNAAIKKGTVDQVKVITWADEEYPSVNTKKLSKAERRLANRRNDSIEDYLSSLDKNIDVDRFSMAERPNALKTFLSTEDVRIKRSLETAGIPNTDTSVKTPSKASKSIVIFVMDTK